jgi:methionyl-tRNA formyltransferase
MTIIFWGSDEFAAQNLENLIQHRYHVVACVTQPDKPRGRSLRVQPSATKKIASAQGLKVLQPHDLRDQEFVDQLKSFEADLFVVIAYGCILNKDILSIPHRFSINVHASLLPKYRGAAPIHWAIINGEEKTGLSIIKIDEHLDAGDLLGQKEIPIDPKDTAVTLKKKMAEESLPFLREIIDRVDAGQHTLTSQDSTQATYAPKLERDLGRLDWRKDAGTVQRLVRGLQPWPGVFCYYGDKKLKILATQMMPTPSGTYQPGQVIKKTDQGFIVAMKSSAILVTDVHLESSRPMSAVQFMAGHQITEGFVFR